jgi:endonuclease YncB( thermonuclease family)
VLLNRERALYGAEVIGRLARDLHIAPTTLYQCTQFARYFPILRDRVKLAWAHYRVLCQVDDKEQREKLFALTVKNGWTSPELEERVRALNAVGIATPVEMPGKLLTARRGTPGLYPVVARREGTAVDLGFKLYLPLAAGDIRRLKLVPGSIVCTNAGPSPSLGASDAPKADLFTYRALAVRVVDGDTLAVTLDLPPHNEADKKLRLRGINCPEMDTPAGKAAKRFVQGLVDQAKTVFVATTKPDKYDRYLADVFLISESGEELYLNNALLENGHAVRMDDRIPQEWE